METPRACKQVLAMPQPECSLPSPRDLLLGWATPMVPVGPAEPVPTADSDFAVLAHRGPTRDEGWAVLDTPRVQEPGFATLVAVKCVHPSAGHHLHFIDTWRLRKEK